MKNDNNADSKRSTPKKLGTRDESVIRAEIAVELEKSTRGNLAQLDRHAKADLEKRIVFDFAKANNLWIEDLYTLGVPMKGGGNENTLAINAETGALYKSNNLFNTNFLVSTLLKQVKAHNLLFPETKYELIGFTGFDNGSKRTPYVEVILKQDYVPNAMPATEQEIADFMLAIGFEKINEYTFRRDEYIVSDLYPRNVLKDENGIIYIVDNIIRF